MISYVLELYLHCQNCEEMAVFVGEGMCYLYGLVFVNDVDAGRLAMAVVHFIERCPSYFLCIYSIISALIAIDSPLQCHCCW